MCVRTKTSFGCGHVFKTTNDCYSSACPGIDRYHYMKEGDCQKCKNGGEDLSRGREGKGRYAQKMKKSQPKEKVTSTTEESAPAEKDVSDGASPWALSEVPDGRAWGSPHRKQADEAWVSEHEDRMSDLNELMEKVKVSEDSSGPAYSTELVLASKDYDYDEDDQDDYEQIPVTPTKKTVHMDIRQRIDDKAQRSRSHRHRDRQQSHDSLPDSMPSYRSSPKIKHASTFNVVGAFPGTAHEYDYHSSPSTPAPTKHHRRHNHGLSNRSRTDPFCHNRSYGHESDYEMISAPPPPLSIPPPAPAMYGGTYEFYSPSASPSGVPYTFPDYGYDLGHPIQPHPHTYIGYPRY